MKRSELYCIIQGKSKDTCLASHLIQVIFVKEYLPLAFTKPSSKSLDRDGSVSKFSLILAGSSKRDEW